MSSNERDRNRGGESDDGFIEKLVAVNRVSKTVKGGLGEAVGDLAAGGGDHGHRKRPERGDTGHLVEGGGDGEVLHRHVGETQYEQLATWARGLS